MNIDTLNIDSRLKKYLPSRGVRIALYALGAFIVALLIVKLIVGVSYRHERFEYRRMPAMHERGTFGRFGDWARPPILRYGESHGATGLVSAVDLPRMTITERDGATREILIATSTAIREGTSTTTAPSALAKDQYVIVFGRPDASGTVNAQFIRIFPPPSASR